MVALKHSLRHLLKSMHCTITVMNGTANRGKTIKVQRNLSFATNPLKCISNKSNNTENAEKWTEHMLNMGGRGGGGMLLSALVDQNPPATGIP